MKSTWSYFKGRARRKATPSKAAASSTPDEWDAGAPSDVSDLPCKNRRVTDGSLLTCLGSDASVLAEKTQLSRTRAWRYLEARWWLSGFQASAEPSAEASSLLPQSGTPPANPAAQPLLHQWKRSASEEDLNKLAILGDSCEGLHWPRRNSLSELDENVGSDLSPTMWTQPAEAFASHCNAVNTGGNLPCPTADLICLDPAN